MERPLGEPTAEGEGFLEPGADGDLTRLCLLGGGWRV